MKEMLGGCCVCADENGWTDNPLIYCDGQDCDVAVHQGCYGIQEVPNGDWFCAKCNASSSSYTDPPPSTNGATPNGRGHDPFICELCPTSHGALKPTEKTNNSGWAHVICALYIPEVRFGDVHSMEPVILQDVPIDRYDRICYICENAGRHKDAKMGACMSCNKPTCKRSFHVTCAQQKGLLCEEGGVSKNVKYCGYCDHHLKKAQNDPQIKVIPACPAPRKASRQQQIVAPTQTHHLPTPPPSTHMLVEQLPRPEVNLGLVGKPITPSSSTTSEDVSTTQSAINQAAFASTTTFSPPLTSSSRSSVALEPTPPLPPSQLVAPSVIAQPPASTSASSTSSLASSASSTSSSASSASPTSSSSKNMTTHHLNTNPETTVAAHLQQIQQQSAVTAATTSSAAENGVYNYLKKRQRSRKFEVYVKKNAESRTGVESSESSRISSNNLPQNIEFHMNGNGDHEEKTVKAVLAPLSKAKRMREKMEMSDKHSKRPRPAGRPSLIPSSSSSVVTGTVSKSASMQRLISLVAPVVSETVSDFQRDRIADRTAAERRAAAALSAPSTSAAPTFAPPPPATQPISVPTSMPMNLPSSLPTNSGLLGSPAAVLAAQLIGTQALPPVPEYNGMMSNIAQIKTVLPTSMEQLFERQCEQGSQLLFSQSSLDVAQLLSSLHQLKSENMRLEERLEALTKRRDHLHQMNVKLSQTLLPDGLPVPRLFGPQPPLPAQPVLAPPTDHRMSHSHQLMMSDELSPLRSLAGAAMISRPTPTHPPATLNSAVAALASQYGAQSVTPSTAGQVIQSVPGIASTATTVAQLQTMMPDFSSFSPDRIAQLSAQLSGAYRNQILTDPSITQLLLSQGYNNINNSLFTRMLTTPQVNAITAAAAAMSASSTPGPLQGTPTTPNVPK